MNNLMKLRYPRVSSLLLNTVCKRNISNTPALYGGFAKDFKPGPYPKTEKERIAAAEKYGLRFLLRMLSLTLKRFFILLVAS
jgi:hypothetical protein